MKKLIILLFVGAAVYFYLKSKKTTATAQAGIFGDLTSGGIYEGSMLRPVSDTAPTMTTSTSSTPTSSTTTTSEIPSRRETSVSGVTTLKTAPTAFSRKSKNLTPFK